MKKDKLIYRIATGIMCLLFMFSAGMYFFANDMATAAFESLGFPTWLIYPLATLKVLGVVAILTKKSIFLKELAYSGFLFDAILALAAHLVVGDGEFPPAVIGIISTSVSWIYDRKLFGLN